MKYEILCPQNVDFKNLHDFKVCHLSERPVYLKLYSHRIEPEFLIKLVYEDERFSLYKTTFGALELVFKLIQQRKLKLVPLKPTTKHAKQRKKTTLKQKLFLIKLMNELEVQYEIPEDRYEASKLIRKLINMKKEVCVS
ncbi:hypothetical protein [Aquifex sp.]